MDINSLTQNVTQDVTQNVTDSMQNAFMFLLVPSIIISVLFLLFFIMHALRRRRVDNAILEIRDILRTMQKNDQAIPEKSEKIQTEN